MQAVILAAGMGKRLKGKTKNHTKSMVKILGKTFLEHSLDKITKYNISRIIIATGYFGDEIKKVIGKSYNGVPVIYIDNEIYDKTNNIYSLYLTKKYLEEEDTLLLESDLIYEQKILEKLIKNPYPNLAVADKYKPHMDGTVVCVNDDDEITAFVPKENFNYKNVDEYYKTVNIYKFSKEFLKKDYLPFLEAYCKTMGSNQYYEQVLRVLLSLERHNMKVLKLQGEKWYEVDDLQDYDIAEVIFCEDTQERYEKLTKRYGGYWRFSELKDFCFLVNPYFPTKKMINEIKNSFSSLLVKYPSCHNIDKILVSNCFDVEEDRVLLGNGAAELINALIPNLAGNIGIILPTFEEYSQKLSKDAIVHRFIPQNKDFSYTKDDLLEFSKEIDTLILVNPDNPSGNYIPKNELLELLYNFKLNNKELILDESFVDFVDGTEENTLIKTEILNKYPNLTVIKSLSKQYGIAGLRLGILASSNKKMLEKCQNNLPIWNINSCAEFFLQIFNKYKNSYLLSCQKIIQTREDFFNKLSEISFLRPIKSSANYILCELLVNTPPLEI